MNKEGYTTLAELLIATADRVVGPSPTPDPVWEFRHMDGRDGHPGAVLSADDILITKFFIVVRNGVPLLGVAQLDDGSFEIHDLILEED